MNSRWCLDSRFLLSVSAACLLAPVLPGSFAEPAAPALPQVKYDSPSDGKVAIVINDAKGRRVRNLFAEADRKAGANSETWDGLNNDGQPVPPGEYTFLGAVTPPVKLLYEFTLNNSGTVPWWRNVDNGNPMREKGGWMSDHSPPWDVAVQGNLVFLASDATEHGNSLNVIDLDGKQVWATRWFGLAGARFVATDERWAYIAAEGAWTGNKFTLLVLSPRSFEYRTLVECVLDSPVAGRGGGLSGLAAVDGIVAAAFNGPLTDMLGSAIAAGAIDYSVTRLGSLQADQVAALLRAAEPKQPWINWPVPDGGVLHVGWGKACPVGAVLSPHRLEVSTLKKGVAYPGDPARDADWEPMEPGPSNQAMNVYTAPGGRDAAALRVRVLNTVAPINWTAPEKQRIEDNTAPKWFTGMKVIQPALRGLDMTAAKIVATGTVFPGGAWENVQTNDITAASPAIYAVSFDKPVTCRGFVVRDPFFLSATVEIRDSPKGPWVSAGEIAPVLQWRRAYTEAYFDFHRDTSLAALRLKVTRPATDQNADAKKRTGCLTNTCSLGGMVLLGTDAFDPPAPPDLGQRVAIYSGDDGKLLQQIPVSSPGALEFTPDGRLLAVSGAKIVEVPKSGGVAKTVLSAGLARPNGLAVGPDGAIYVADVGDNTVKQFSPDGKLVRAIGKPGGLEAGPYDPCRMSMPMGLALDGRGRLWVAEHESRPKKISVWSLTNAAPSLDAYYIGGPPYGGDYMFPDPGNPSRFFFEGMEFEADWTTGKSRLKNIVWRGGRGLAWDNITPARPVVSRDRLYLLSEPQYFYDGFQVAGYRLVAQYDEARGIAVPVAAAGLAEAWPPMKTPALRDAMDDPKARYAFIWSDLNCNERVDREEVQLQKTDKPDDWRRWMWHISQGYDLSMQFAGTCLEPVKILTRDKKAVPVYSFDRTRPTPKSAGAPTIAYGDNYHSMGVTRADQIIELSSIISVKPRTGDPLWTYPAPWPGTQLSGKAPPPAPGLVVGQLGVMGTAVLPDAGEVFAFVGDKGDICVFTTDGLFVARLFRDNRYGRCFNFPEAKRGMEVGDVSINGEHFGGTFTQMKDGRILLVVGHNHNSVVRVEGLDKIRRFSGKVSVGAEVGGPSSSVKAAPSPVKAAGAAGITVDGALGDWKDRKFVEVKGAGDHAGRMAMAWDAGALLLAFDVAGRPALKNEGDDWGLLFKSGDSVDLQLATDPAADAGRTGPAPGDLRLLLGEFKGKPVGVLYRYNVPGSAPDTHRTYASPVNKVVVQGLERIEADIRIAKRDGGGYVVEASVPWTSLRAKPPSKGSTWRGDLGILFASEGGNVVERKYWFNPDTGLVSDVPGEIQCHPDKWGSIVFE